MCDPFYFRVARLTVQATSSAADFESFSDRPIEVVPSVEVRAPSLMGIATVRRLHS